MIDTKTRLSEFGIEFTDSLFLYPFYGNISSAILFFTENNIIAYQQQDNCHNQAGKPVGNKNRKDHTKGDAEYNNSH